jgi:hypothetical protein
MITLPWTSRVTGVLAAFFLKVTVTSAGMLIDV